MEFFQLYYYFTHFQFIITLHIFNLSFSNVIVILNTVKIGIQPWKGMTNDNREFEPWTTPLKQGITLRFLLSE